MKLPEVDLVGAYGGLSPTQRASPSQEIWANVAPRAGAVAVVLVLAGILLLRLPRAKRPLTVVRGATACVPRIPSHTRGGRL